MCVCKFSVFSLSQFADVFYEITSAKTQTPKQGGDQSLQDASLSCVKRTVSAETRKILILKEMRLIFSSIFNSIAA